MSIIKSTFLTIKCRVIKSIRCALVILFFGQTAFSQTPNESAPRKKVYHVNYITGSIIIAGGLATDYPSIGRIKNKPTLTNAEILDLNTSIIGPIDQWALHQNTSHYAMFSKLSDDIEPPIFIILPALFGFDKKIRKDWLDLLFMYCEGHVVTFTIYNYSWLGPTFENKYRPITYYTNLPMDDRTTGNNRNSAYSGHTASVTYTTFFLAKVYCDYHPDASKLFWYTMALIPPLAMGYIRVRALAHFPSDVMTGLTVGALVGIILPELHKNTLKGVTLGLITVPGAMGMSGFWTIPSSHKFSDRDKLITASIPTIK